MLNIIDNIVSQKNLSSNKEENRIQEPYLSKSIFNELNKYLLRKEIEFDNVCTEEKKDDYKHIISSNFVINNLLNIFNKKDIFLISDNTVNKNNNIQKKKLDKFNNSSLNKSTFFKKNKVVTEEINTHQTEKLKIESKVSKYKYNQSYSNEPKTLDKTKEIQNLNSITLSNHFSEHKENLINSNKNYMEISKCQKNVIDSKNIKNIKNYKNSLFLFKNISKKDNLINFKQDKFDSCNKKENIKNNIDSSFFYDSNNSIKWKKSITQKILLSIANKKNYAEIYLKPEYLGSIYIKIKMKDNRAKLKIISHYDEVRSFFDNQVPFLRDALIKNGITLEKFNIYSSLRNKKLEHSKSMFLKKNSHSDKFKKEFIMYERNIDNMKYKVINVYV